MDSLLNHSLIARISQNVLSLSFQLFSMYFQKYYPCDILENKAANDKDIITVYPWINFEWNSPWQKFISQIRGMTVDYTRVQFVSPAYPIISTWKKVCPVFHYYCFRDRYSTTAYQRKREKKRTFHRSTLSRKSSSQEKRKEG